ncbi:MAG: D-alanine--D-alanine ligase [Propionibacteriaceae bacterium]|jgi:D-alanine-D-alanine ligase|nr:D-alanine--D-alanine ligase [Propionibacteriaceae bacterium]
MANKPCVLLVFGGVSSEHEISCLTAGGVLGALDPDRFEALCVGISKAGDWLLADPAVVRSYRVDGRRLPQVDPTWPAAVIHRHGRSVEVARLDGDRLVDPRSVDLAFGPLHGPFGEDGTIQGQFEMLGLPYVGAGVLSSAAAMDKSIMKGLLVAAGLPVGPWRSLAPGEWRLHPERCRQRLADLSYPLFVKPARGGSSIGISRVDRPERLDQAIETALRFDPKLVVEQGFTAVREVECAVLIDRARDEVEASAPGEIEVLAQDRFYDFEAKYLPDQPLALVVPAQLDPATTAEVQRLARAACRALDVEGLARVDTFVTERGVFLNEINTMPGFTPTSLFPTMWAASGLDYPSLVTRLLEEALSRPAGLR